MLKQDIERGKRLEKIDEVLNEGEDIFDILERLGFEKEEVGHYKNRKLSKEYTQAVNECCNETDENEDCQCDSNDNEETSIADLLKYIDGDYETYESIEDLFIEYEDEEDLINFPSHYNLGEVQTLDYIDDVLIHNKNLTALDGYYMGNILKYGGVRLGNKGEITVDMGKMKFYMDRWLKHRE